MSSAVETIVQHVRSALETLKHPSDRAVVIGLSGGLDSQVLAHALQSAAEQDGPPLLAVHIDHGLRSESSQDAQKVEELCASWDLPCTVSRVDVDLWDASLRQGTESAARNARYAALARAALDHDTDTIAVAHHLDDQVETVLMRIIGGTGLEGLGGMSLVTRRPVPLDPGRPALRRLQIFRPLLDVPRSDLEAYAAAVGIVPINDPTNSSIVYRRNAIRQTVVPALESIEPGFRSSLSRTCDLLQDDAQFVSDTVDELFNEVVANRSEVWMVERKKFRNAHRAIQRRILFRIIDAILGVHARVSHERLEALRNATLEGQPGKIIELADGVVGYVDYDRLAIGHSEKLEHDLRKLSWVPLLEPGTEIELNGEVDVPLKNGWRVRGNVGHHEKLLLRTRHEGDRTRVRGREIKLQDWFVNQKVPRYLRDWLPIVVHERDVRWVIGLDFTVYPDNRSGIELGLELDLHGGRDRS